MCYFCIISEKHSYYLAKYRCDGLTYRTRLRSTVDEKFEVQFTFARIPKITTFASYLMYLIIQFFHASKVIYVDYGNVEIVTELFEWDHLCDTVPMQAIALYISGIAELEKFTRLVCRHDDAPMKRIENYLWDHLYSKFIAKIM